MYNKCVCALIAWLLAGAPHYRSSKLPKHNLVGVVGSDSLGWQACEGEFSGELWGKLQRFTFPHTLYKINLPFSRDNSAPVHGLSILKTCLISRNCLCCEGEFREVAKPWQSAGKNKKIIWPFEFILLTVFQRQIGRLWERTCGSLFTGRQYQLRGSLGTETWKSANQFDFSFSVIIRNCLMGVVLRWGNVSQIRSEVCFNFLIWKDVVFYCVAYFEIFYNIGIIFIPQFHEVAKYIL